MSRLVKFLFSRFIRRPQTRAELVEAFRDAEQQNIVDSDSEGMLEGVLQVTEMQIKDIMIPRSQMISINKEQSFDEILTVVIDAMHSRYPVIGEHHDDIEGILLAKDLLHYSSADAKQDFSLRKIIQPVIVVPETQRLDKLLKDLKTRRCHMAIVVDEYAHIAGLVTMEDVLEQIVGDIEDESDYDEDDGIKQFKDYYVIKADVTLDEFNEHFNSTLDDSNYETIGGFALHHLGHIPKRNETFQHGRFTFTVLHAGKRRIRLLQVNIIA